MVLWIVTPTPPPSSQEPDSQDPLRGLGSCYCPRLCRERGIERETERERERDRERERETERERERETEKE